LSAPTTTTKEIYRATFDKGDDDESPLITFVWGANLECLTIEAFVDLTNPKLIVQFQDSLAASAPSAKSKANNSQPPKATSSEWSEEDAQWASNGDLDW